MSRSHAAEPIVIIADGSQTGVPNLSGATFDNVAVYTADCYLSGLRRVALSFPASSDAFPNANKHNTLRAWIQVTHSSQDNSFTSANNVWKYHPGQNASMVSVDRIISAELMQNHGPFRRYRVIVSGVGSATNDVPVLFLQEETDQR